MRTDTEQRCVHVKLNFVIFKTIAYEENLVKDEVLSYISTSNTENKLGSEMR
jgi:hypothetical protein